MRGRARVVCTRSKRRTSGFRSNRDTWRDHPGPLFFTQYSYLGYDPRGMRDKYTNYFRNNQNESLVSQAYSVANPGHFKGYGANSWGLTADEGLRQNRIAGVFQALA